MGPSFKVLGFFFITFKRSICNNFICSLVKLKAAKNLQHTFQITQTFFQSSANAKFNMKCYDQLMKQIVGRFFVRLVFIIVFKEINGSLKKISKRVKILKSVCWIYR